MLDITTGPRCNNNPPPGPNPPGPTPGITPQVTPKTPQPTPGSESPGRGTTGEKAMMRDRYTCYAQPCIHCADPFLSHLTPECNETKSIYVGLRLLWQSVTHRGIQLLAQAHRWNNCHMEDDEPCDVCGTELKEHDLRDAS